MIKQDRGGRIINMASQARRRVEALVAVYCATKAAVISLTQSAGLNLIKYSINVNAIAPGVVEGEHWDGVDALFAKYEHRPARREEAPRRRGGPVRPHGHRRRSGRDGNIPRRTGKHLRRRPDLQCRWRQLDELRDEAMRLAQPPLQAARAERDGAYRVLS
jgi:NAD(P)-dependent dehydrogenase (short-subunit alcohol dehydrogenase family)